MASEPLVLVVDDEVGILRVIRLELSAQGFHVVTASDGAEALKLVEEHRPDVVVLDIMMPEMSGFEVMKQIRTRSEVPIIFLTAKDGDRDKITGLDLGADDYLPKPFSPDELAARVRAVLRRSGRSQTASRIVRNGKLEIDLERRIVEKEGNALPLTRNEWLLLQALAANAGKVMLNSELLTKVWGSEYRDDVQYLRVWVSRLRQKLEDDPSTPVVIKTMQGIGYMLVPEVEESPEEEASKVSG